MFISLNKSKGGEHMQDTFIIGKQRECQPLNEIDLETGEVKTTIAQVCKPIIKDYNFHKIFLENFWHCFSKISNSKATILFYLLLHCDNKNKINITYNELIEKTGCSLQTVSKTINSLKKTNFLKFHNGTYMINPDIISNCDSKKRRILKDKYNNF